MDPKQTAKNYDDVAAWWLAQMEGSNYGLSALERACLFLGQTGRSLDVGCGAEGRFLGFLLKRGFRCTGLDISSQMLELVKTRYPEVRFYLGDICCWELPEQFDLITAWDSTFHLPLENQASVLEKLCAGLAPKGILLFTCGGGEDPGEIRGEFGGRPFAYSTLGVPQFQRLLEQFGCSVEALEYDQQPENHVYFIARKLP